MIDRDTDQWRSDVHLRRMNLVKRGQEEEETGEVGEECRHVHRCWSKTKTKKNDDRCANLLLLLYLSFPFISSISLDDLCSTMDTFDMLAEREKE